MSTIAQSRKVTTIKVNMVPPADEKKKWRRVFAKASPKGRPPAIYGNPSNDALVEKYLTMPDPVRPRKKKL